MLGGPHNDENIAGPLPGTHARERLKLLGLTLTLVWIVFSAYLVIYKWDSSRSMPLNEWGDFFAGFFAPLAFLWLVLGFFQQGKELQLSTAALQLQAKELQASVEQQKELVEVTRRQVESEFERHQQQLQQFRRSAQPSFVFSTAGYGSGPQGYQFSFELGNEGNTATNLRFSYVPDLQLPPIHELSSFSRGQRQKLTLHLKGNEGPFIVDISYRDAHDMQGHQKFKVSPVWEPPVRLRFERVASNDIPRDLSATQ